MKNTHQPNKNTHKVRLFKGSEVSAEEACGEQHSLLPGPLLLAVTHISSGSFCKLSDPQRERAPAFPWSVHGPAWASWEMTHHPGLIRPTAPRAHCTSRGSPQALRPQKGAVCSTFQSRWVEFNQHGSPVVEKSTSLKILN